MVQDVIFYSVKVGQDDVMYLLLDMLMDLPASDLVEMMQLGT